MCVRMEVEESDTVSVPNFLHAIVEGRRATLQPAEAAVLRAFIGPRPWIRHDGGAAVPPPPAASPSAAHFDSRLEDSQRL